MGTAALSALYDYSWCLYSIGICIWFLLGGVTGLITAGCIGAACSPVTIDAISCAAQCTTWSYSWSLKCV